MGRYGAMSNMEEEAGRIVSDLHSFDSKRWATSKRKSGENLRFHTKLNMCTWFTYETATNFE